MRCMPSMRRQGAERRASSCSSPAEQGLRPVGTPPRAAVVEERRACHSALPSPTARRKMVAPELRFLALAAMAATARAQGTSQPCTYAHTLSSLWFLRPCGMLLPPLCCSCPVRKLGVPFLYVRAADVCVNSACSVPRLTDISGIVATCCQNQAQPDCSDGFPAGCSVACAQELVPYEAQCHTMLSAFGSTMGLGFDLRELSTYVVGPDRHGGACSHTLALRNAAQLNGGSACGDMSARSQAVTDACCVESGVYQCGSGAQWQCK
jgi:hypothetical protein